MYIYIYIHIWVGKLGEERGKQGTGGVLVIILAGFWFVGRGRGPGVWVEIIAMQLPKGDPGRIAVCPAPKSPKEARPIPLTQGSTVERCSIIISSPATSISWIHSAFTGLPLGFYTLPANIEVHRSIPFC